MEIKLKEKIETSLIENTKAELIKNKIREEKKFLKKKRKTKKTSK